ncbi:epoxide hydrolase 3-like [Physcomitrium patens]|uniref:epoxide hydrolase 3-like n=1 Tax=Physcomitrium patens TaxID=3218 RepID=UPI00024ACB0F|nr:uncharacterized protein LOC112277528 [Physcomitrium patens]|eukprot:XP_024365743.1 uncharacterized protein LOC112277528 [Physcomitrella patens]
METPAWMSKLTYQTVKTNGIDLHFVEQGTGPTVLLLHGFPEIWYGWRYQIPPLVERGYHVAATDLRGNGKSKGPSDIGLYTILHVVGDMIGLLDDLKEERVFVVGHDWGALIAWELSLKNLK